MKNYPVKIECYDGERLVFTASVFDKHAVEIEIKSLVGRNNVDELLAKIKEAVLDTTEPT